MSAGGFARPRRGPGTAGQSMVEFAIILLIFVLLIFGVIDLGRVVYIQSMIGSAAREAARYGIVNPGADLDAYARSRIIGVNPADVAVNPDLHTPPYIRVEVVYHFRPVTPLLAQFLPGGEVLVRSSSMMRRE